MDDKRTFFLFSPHLNKICCFHFVLSLWIPQPNHHSVNDYTWIIVIVLRFSRREFNIFVYLKKQYMHTLYKIHVKSIIWHLVISECLYAGLHRYRHLAVWNCHDDVYSFCILFTRHVSTFILASVFGDSIYIFFLACTIYIVQPGIYIYNRCFNIGEVRPIGTCESRCP